MKKKKGHVSLTPEQLELCPFGSSKCKICSLPAEDIKSVHDLKLETKWTSARILAHLESLYGIETTVKEIKAHFKLHIKENHEEALIQQAKHPEIVKALAVIDSQITVTTDKDLEKAYQSLVKMAYSYTKRVRDLQNLITDIIETKVKSGAINEEIDGLSALELLERLARLSKESREQVKDISALRAPKVMVAQLLNNFFVEVIRQMGTILTDLCGQLKYDITEELKQSGMLRQIAPDFFDTVFRNVALAFRDTMISVQREQTTKAMAALKDLEKII